jgi:hypothetical protein
MEPWRTILLVFTIFGFLVTVGGLVAAYRSARREYSDAADRITLMRDITKREQQSHAALEPGPDLDIRNEAINQEYEQIYAKNDLVRPSYDNIVYLAQYESQRLLGMVLNGTRRDFLIAGVGLLVSTVASSGSLYLTGS